MVDLTLSRFSNKRKFVNACKRGLRDVIKNPGRSFLIILTVALGVALAITIITAANGIGEKVRSLLQDQHLPEEFSLKNIHGALDQGRDLLTYLAYLFSGLFVATVTWTSMEQRRYAIGASRAKGITTKNLIIEYLVEAIILCLAGGITGILLGAWACHIIPNWYPLLPMKFQWSDVLRVFPQVSGFSFLVTFGITLILAFRPNTSAQL